MGVGEGDDRDGREKDGRRDMSGRKKRERETEVGERKIERQEREREREREIGRETGVGERERGEREKITNTNKFMELYLVVLHSAERSEARQVSCYNPLSYFNPVTRDKVGKKKIERETGWERERKI